MTKLPPLKPRQMIRALGKAGFHVIRIKGSHHIMFNPDTERVVPVPYHAKDMRRGMVQAIIKQSGLTRDEFLDLL